MQNKVCCLAVPIVLDLAFSACKEKEDSSQGAAQQRVNVEDGRRFRGHYAHPG